MSAEEWRDCIGYEGLYQVSSKGRVRSLRRKTRINDKDGYIMRQKFDGHGYYRVNLHKDGKMKAELVSRLVALAFIPNPSNLPQTGHMNDIKTDNTVENLYWTDSRENNFHNGKHERFQALHNAKIQIIADKLAKPVEAINTETGEVLRFPSMQEASRILGCDSGKICMVCKGQRTKHFGYYWRYSNGNT